MACVDCTTKLQLQQESAMIKKNSIVSSPELKGLLEGDQDVLKELVRTVVHQTLETEMGSAPGAARMSAQMSVWAIKAAIMTPLWRST